MPARGSRSLRIVKFCAWTVVASALLLEAVMQVGAYAVHLLNRSRKVTPAGEQVVLCVGDSWTQGMGCSDQAKHSYPAVLQELLRARTGEEWTVVNGGQAGQNSRDVLARLTSQLRDARPRAVCVLVGRNDYWTNPPEMTDLVQEEYAEYRFRWRLPRLFAYVGDLFVAASSSAVPSSGFAALGPQWVPRPPHWPELRCGVAKPWREDAATNVALSAGWRKANAGDPTAARAEFDEVLRRSPTDARALHGGFLACQKAGLASAGTPYLRSLEEEQQRRPNFWIGRTLAMCYQASGRSEAAAALAKQVLAEFEADGELWLTRASAEFQVGADDEALTSSERAIALWPSIWSFGMQYQILNKAGNVDEAARTLYAGYVACNDADWAMQWLVNLLSRNEVDAARLQRELDAFDCATDVRARLQRIIDAAVSREDGVEAGRVLTAHLRRIAQVVRNAGALPVFLNYPLAYDSSKYGDPLRTVAREDRIDEVNVTERFAAKTRGRDVEALRSADGHVNDEGYRLVAECVADGLQPLLANGK